MTDILKNHIYALEEYLLLLKEIHPANEQYVGVDRIAIKSAWVDVLHSETPVNRALWEARKHDEFFSLTKEIERKKIK